MKKSIICGLVILFPILCNGQHYLYLGFMNSAIKVEKEMEVGDMIIFLTDMLE